MKTPIPPPVDVFGRPYTKEFFSAWRKLSAEQRFELIWRGRPELGEEGVKRLLQEFKRCDV